MLPAHVYLGEDILKSGVLVLFIDVIHAPGNIEEGNHFLNILVNQERVGFAGRLKNVVASARDPIMLEISPGPLEDVAVNGSRVSMTTEDAWLDARGADYTTARSGCSSSMGETIRLGLAVPTRVHRREWLA